MNSLLFWIGIGILGFLLYISPGIFVHRMYEGFAANGAGGVAKSADATSAKVVNLQPSAAPKEVPVNNNQLDNLLQLLNTPPDSPTNPQDPQTNRPIEHATT